MSILFMPNFTVTKNVKKMKRLLLSFFFDFWGNILRFPRMILYLWDLNCFYYEKDFICVYGDVLLYGL